MVTPHRKIIINNIVYPLFIGDNKTCIASNILDNDEIKYVVQIPEDTVEIPEKAFAECKGLYAIITPKSNTIKIIGVEAFKNCINLEIMTMSK